MLIQLDLDVIANLQGTKILSKTDAFIDLCHWASEPQISPMGLQFPVGYIYTSTQELAKRWGWAWATANSFLQNLIELQAIRVIKREKDKKFIINILITYYQDEEE